MNCNKSVGIVCIKLKSSLIFFLLEKTELTIEDKYKRTMQEIECLKDELGKFFLSFTQCKMTLRPQKNIYLRHINHIPQLQDPKSQEGLKTQQIA